MPQRWLSAGVAGFVALALAAVPLTAQDASLRPHTESTGVLRVCADPDNMPASNEKAEGYENKIAELIATEWHSKVEYAWWPVRRGFFARALNGRYCDVAITAPAGLDLAATTKPYFRSAYVIVYRKDSGLNLTSLNDPTWKKLKIGVHLLNADAENTPPAMAMSAHGVVGNLVGFTTFYSDINRPDDIIKAVIDKKIDVAIVWGPAAGYFAKQASVPLALNPILSDSASNIPFAFSIAMGVRRRDRDLRDSLQAVIDRKRPEIEAILRDFSVPLLPAAPDSGRATTPPAKDAPTPSRAPSPGRSR